MKGDNHCPRLGVIGLGEVVLDAVYAGSGLIQLEREGGIRIVKVANTRDFDGTISKLEQRLQCPSEKTASEYYLQSLRGRRIEHYQVRGDSFDDENARRFFNDIDMVYLATPNNLRIRFANQIVDFRKHIIIEKPMGSTIEILNEIVGILSKNKDLKSICASHYSYKGPSLKFFTDFSEKTRDYGKITSIEGFLEENDFLGAERYKWLLDPVQSGGGIWIDTGSHLMTLLYKTGTRMADVIRATSYRYSFGKDLEERNKLMKSEVAADVLMRLSGDNGNIRSDAIAHLVVSKCKPKHLKHFTINFEKGRVCLNFMNNSISYTAWTGNKEEHTEEIIPKQSPYYNMFRMFIDYCFNNGIEPPTTMRYIKPSADATFDVYRYMKEGDPRLFFLKQ